MLECIKSDGGERSEMLFLPSELPVKPRPENWPHPDPSTCEESDAQNQERHTGK
jgi:hypothetical protein